MITNIVRNALGRKGLRGQNVRQTGTAPARGSRATWTRPLEAGGGWHGGCRPGVRSGSVLFRGYKKHARALKYYFLTPIFARQGLGDLRNSSPGPKTRPSRAHFVGLGDFRPSIRPFSTLDP